MTGPEHYTEAENGLLQASHADEHGRDDAARLWLGFAQVHAMLALTAAALAVGKDSLSTEAHRAWREAMSS